MDAELLSSNVLNYLVWRYLQEAGYGRAALHLSSQWNRDPDSLPFAKNVQPRTLIHIVQDGLLFDALQAQATPHGQKHYYFGADHGRPYSDRDGNLLTLDQGVPAHQIAEEAGPVPEPPPKKGKKKKAAKTNGVVAPIAPPDAQVNGDAMDIDQNGHTHVTNSVRAESEIAPSDVESPSVAELPLSTLSLGQSNAAQTDGAKQLATDTLFFCSVTDPYKKVTQTSWGPPEAPLFLTSGHSILRLHLVDREKADSANGLRKYDLNLPPESYRITALCWNSQGELTVSAREEKSNERGEVLKTDRLYKFLNGGEQYRLISSTAGLVMILRWNASKRLLLALSSDDNGGSIKIWRDAEPNDLDSQLPLWTMFTPTTLHDVLWISDSLFVVCGVSIFAIYEVSDAGLTCARQLKTDITWESIKYDAASGILAALGRPSDVTTEKRPSPNDVATQEQTRYLGIVHPSSPDTLRVEEYPDPYFTDLDFRPHAQMNGYDASTSTAAKSTGPVLLATVADPGIVRIWDVNAAKPFTCLKKFIMPDESMALSIVFSPNGRLLAAAGPDTLALWEVDSGRRSKDGSVKEKAYSGDLGSEPVAIWRARECIDGSWDPNADGDFSIGWAPDSRCVSMALGNQIAIIPV